VKGNNMFGLFGKPIKVSQGIIKQNFQPWLLTILLVDDKEAARLDDWTVGFYHCTQCGAYQGFAYQLPPVQEDALDGRPYGGVNPQAHNDRNAFWRAHAHGDGRVLLFEKDLPDLQPPSHAIINVYMEDGGGGGFLVHTTPPLNIGRSDNPTITFGVIIKRMDEQNELLRSAHEIAKRKGVDTNWEAFENSLRKELLRQAGAPESTDEQEILRATVTPRSYRIPPSD
jgi:hypothetical protein